MKFLRNFSYIILLPFFLFSCSVEKRRYNDGYRVVWNTNKSNQKKHQNDLNFKIDSLNMLCSNDNMISDIYDINPLIGIVLKTNNCDNIILKDGKEISAKVLEINKKSIIYKDCDNLDGPKKMIDKSSVFKIKYVNGKSEVFTDVENAKKTEEIDENGFFTGKSNSKSPSNSLRKQEIKNHPLAVLSFVCLFLFPPLAFIFGIISLIEINNKKDEYKGQGLAIAGIVISLLFIFILLMLIL